jgi:hypothetical protein
MTVQGGQDGGVRAGTTAQVHVRCGTCALERFRSTQEETHSGEKKDNLHKYRFWFDFRSHQVILF